MLRVYADFQAVNPDEPVWGLKFDGKDLGPQAETLGIKVGDKVILDPCEDFEVMGFLDFRFVDLLGREDWVAVADWSTRRDKPAPSK